MSISIIYIYIKYVYVCAYVCMYVRRMWYDMIWYDMTWHDIHIYKQTDKQRKTYNTCNIYIYMYVHVATCIVHFVTSMYIIILLCCTNSPRVWCHFLADSKAVEHTAEMSRDHFGWCRHDMGFSTNMVHNG